jgi:serine phosphatase RsbU (regulator of sigma subunit)
MYTDGVVEAIDGNACEFGEARLQALAAQAPGGSAQSVVQAISAAVRAYSGDNVLFDDVTLMVVRRD